MSARYAAAGALALLAVACLAGPGGGSPAAELNLAAVSCAKYQNDLLAKTTPAADLDAIDTVMWLFGYSIAKSGERVMYGDSLRAFGFALDAECKNNPTASLLDAVGAVKSKRENPMDLTRLDCASFDTRHAALRKSDPESAKTVAMWLFGFSTGLAGSHLLDADALGSFDAALEDHCFRHPEDSLFDALRAPNPAVPGANAAGAKPATPQKAAAKPRTPKPAELAAPANS